MARLPMMKIDSEASHFFAPDVARGPDQVEKLLRFGSGKERRIEKLCDPMRASISLRSTKPAC
jgi:hypothetical protein